MRSEILLESKPRSNHGRHCLQRRRLAKSAAMVNGEYDPDLALAIQESLKQAELDRHKRQNPEKENFKASPDNQKFSQSRKMAKVSLQDESEIQRLKDLVSVHMDLIQQQQEQISKKDKTIRSLKQDNSAVSIFSFRFHIYTNNFFDRSGSDWRKTNQRIPFAILSRDWSCDINNPQPVTIVKRV